MTTPNLAEAAHGYTERGYAVFPLWPIVDGQCACHDGAACASPGKHPRVRRGLHQATTHQAQIATWWGRWPDANIGLPAGHNNLAILDVDPYHGGDTSLTTLTQQCWHLARADIMATRTVRTGSGGLHLYYRAPADGIKSGSRTFGLDGLDTRGRGGYVVAPPSRHITGARYTVMNSEHPLMVWPDCLTALIPADPPPANQPAPAETGNPPANPAGPQAPNGKTSRGRAWALAALTNECEQLRALTTEGSGRNNALNVAAYKLGRRVAAGLIAETDVANALHAAASTWAGHGEREIRATITSGLRAGMERAHSGPADHA